MSQTDQTGYADHADHVVRATRADYEPTGGPNGQAHTQGEMREMCTGTTAVILATDTDTDPFVIRFGGPEGRAVTCQASRDGKSLARPLQLYEGAPLVTHALKAAYGAQVDRVFVITIPAISQQVSSVSYAVRRRKQDPALEVLECDIPLIIERTHAAGDINVFGIPYGILEIARTLAGTGLVRSDAVFLLRSDMPYITKDHLYDLCANYRARQGCDVFSANVNGQPRPPYLFATDYLDRLAEQAEANGLR